MRSRSNVWRACAPGVGLVILGMAESAQALVGGPEPGAATAETVRLPNKPASVRGLADLPSPNLFTAQVNYSVPIELPGGRGGFGPSLALGYSGELGNGSLGLGWRLAEVSIRRSLRQGVPTYTDADELEIVGLGGGGRLYSGDGQRYWVEGQGKSVRIERKGTWFEATQANGLKYVLGRAAGARQEEDGKVAAWYVESIIDLVGQRVDFTYDKVAGQVYLRSIVWGPGNTPQFRAQIEYDGRPDITTSYATGFEVRTVRRISDIVVYVRPEEAEAAIELRRYLLTYADETTGSQVRLSRLASIEMLGRGGENRLALPKTSFDYFEPDPSTVLRVAGIAGWVLNERGVSLADVDGDGMADLLRLELGNHGYRKGNGAGFSDRVYAITGGDSVDLGQVRLMDLDGDSRPDLVRIVDDTWRWSRLVADKPGALTFHWEPQGVWPGSTGVPLDAPAFAFADVNGDGRTDVLQGTAGSLLVRLNGSAGLGEVQRMPGVSGSDAAVEVGKDDLQLADINGDGLVDVVWLQDEWMKTWLGRGDGRFVPLNRFNYPWGRGAFDVSDIRLADLDRDGLLDLVRITAGHVSWFQGLPAGGLASQGRFVDRPPGSPADAVVAVADANGNGSQDVVWSSADGMWIIDFAGAGTAGMLREITNGLGLRTAITYQPSAHLSVIAEEKGQAWVHKLPVVIPVPVLLESVVEAGGPPRRTEIAVRDGFWDGDERRFGGFLFSERMTKGRFEADVLREQTRYHAGIGVERVVRGMVASIDRLDVEGKPVTRLHNSWTAVPIQDLPHGLPGARQALKDWTGIASFEGVAQPIESLVKFEYDPAGRLTREINQGRLDLEGDEQIIERSYGSDLVTGVRDRVCVETIYEKDGTTVRSQTKRTYGDNTGPASMSTAESGSGCPVGKGWSLKTEGVLLAFPDPSAAPSRSVTLREAIFDSFGNETRFVEAGVAHDVGYDPEHFRIVSDTLHPTPTSSLSWTISWDPVLGMPQSLTEPNQLKTTIDYDNLGRPTSVRRSEPPKDGDPGKDLAAHVRYRYDWGSPRSLTHTYEFDGAESDLAGAGDPPGPGWRRTVAVANGAGEQMYVATELGEARWIVSGWKERDERGLEVVSAEPFYWSSAQLPTTRPPDTKFSTSRHDGLGRLVRADLPNGAAKTVAYKAFEQTATDSELAPVRTVTDGLGRVIHTERNVPPELETADSQYDAAGRLTRVALQRNRAVHTYAYDSLGRLREANDPDIGLREMKYSDLGHLIRQKNGMNQVVGFFFDGAGRLIGRGPRTDWTSPAESFSPTNRDYVYHYDTADPAIPGRTRTASRLSSVEEPGAEDPSKPPGPGKVAFAYDSFGRQVAMLRSIGSVTGWQRTAYSPSGLIRHQEADDGFQVDYAYDKAGRLQSAGRTSAPGDIWLAGSGSVADTLNGLDAAGRVMQETYGNGLRQAYERDALGLSTRTSLSSVAAGGMSTLLFGVGIQRNAYGAPTDITDLLPMTGRDQKARYHYDGGARLKEAILGDSSSTKWIFRYSYDGLQNMTGRFQVPPPNTPSIGIISGYYRYGENGKGPRQLTSILHKDCPGFQSLYDYDAAGRLTKDGDKALVYDEYDQLTEVRTTPSTNLQRTHYGYEGLRTYSTGTAPNSETQYWFSADYSFNETIGKRWHYVMVGDRAVARLSQDNTTTTLTASLTSSSPSQGAASFGPVDSLLAGQATAYLFLLGFVVVAVTAARRGSPRPMDVAVLWLLSAVAACAQDESLRAGVERRELRVYFHPGASAGPQVLTDTNGNIVDERRFEPFGQKIEADLTRDRINILNKETSIETGWSYHGNRWMSPQTARWLTPDPAMKGPSGRAAAWLLHPYTYVLQNPMMYWDADGNEERRSPGLESWTGVRIPEPGALLSARPFYENSRARDWALKGSYVHYAEFLEAGHGCTACHITHGLGRVPTDQELDLGAYDNAAHGMKVLSAIVEFITTVGGARAAWQPRSPTNRELAEKLWVRNQQLHSSRSEYMQRNGTVSMAIAENRLTGELRIFVATESELMDSAFKLRVGEQFVEGLGHAEQTLLNGIGKDWKILAGATSRNICLPGGCAWILGKMELGIGGPFFKGSKKTQDWGHQMFWRQ
jgi:RHS repeat-associated protein